MAQNNIKTRRLNPEGLKNFYEQNPEYLDVCQADTDKKREEEKEKFYDYYDRCCGRIRKPSDDGVRASFHSEEHLKAHLLNLLQLIKTEKSTIETYTQSGHLFKLELFKDLFKITNSRNVYTAQKTEEMEQSLRNEQAALYKCSFWTYEYVCKSFKVRLLSNALFHRKKKESSGNNDQNIAKNHKSNLKKIDKAQVKKFYEDNLKDWAPRLSYTNEQKDKDKKEFCTYYERCYNNTISLSESKSNNANAKKIRFYNEDDLKAHLLDVVELIKKNKTTIQTYTKMHHHNKLKLFKNLFDTRRLGNNYNEQNLEALQKPRNDYTKTSLEALKESLRKGAMQCNEVSSWTEKYVRVAAKQELLRAVIQHRKNTRTETKKNQSSDNNEQNIANNYESNLLQVKQSHSNSNSFVTFPNALNLDNQDEASEVDLRNFHFDERNLNALLAELNAGNQDNLMTNPYSANQNLCIPQKRPNNELSASNNDELSKSKKRKINPFEGEFSNNSLQANNQNIFYGTPSETLMDLGPDPFEILDKELSFLI